MTLSYHNDPEVKARHVAMAQHHYEADMLRAGTYGSSSGLKLSASNFRACSVACMAFDIDPESHDRWLYGDDQAEKGPHRTVAESAGWPIWLVRLNDVVFEGLQENKRGRFHVDLREAVPVGKDLKSIKWKLSSLRLTKVLEYIALSPYPYLADVEHAIREAITYCDDMGRGPIVLASQQGVSEGDLLELGKKYAAGQQRLGLLNLALDQLVVTQNFNDPIMRALHCACTTVEPNASPQDPVFNAAILRCVKYGPEYYEHYLWEAQTLLQLLRTL